MIMHTVMVVVSNALLSSSRGQNSHRNWEKVVEHYTQNSYRGTALILLFFFLIWFMLLHVFQAKTFAKFSHRIGDETFYDKYL